MKKSLLFFMLIFCLSCGKREIFIPGKTINLGVESKSISEQIKSVSVVPFKVDDSWKYISEPLMTKIGDTFIFITKETCFLIGYKEDGNKVFARHIKGRGRGEVLEVNNIYSCGDTICVYDVSKCEVEMYDKNGNFCSKIEGPFQAEYLYPLKDHLIGMTAISFKGDKYVTVFDKERNIIDDYLTIPNYLKNQSMKFGRTPMSYCYKDSVRFMIPYDYNIYSVSENGIESRYCFVPENPIPTEVLEKLESNTPALDRIQMVGQYDDDFQELFETERFLFFYYSQKHVLYDKRTGIVFKTQNPQDYYHKEFASNITDDELWKYIIGSFVPLYSEGNEIFGRLPKNCYDILNDCRSRLDSKMISLLKGMDEYLMENDLKSDDVFIVRIVFDE